MIYVDDPEQAAEILELAPAEAGSNVWLLRPFDDVVYSGTRRRRVEGTKGAVDVITALRPAQAFVDLASSPGRGPEEAEADASPHRGGAAWRLIAIPLYVRSRRVLLDALDSLGPHRRSVVLVGAQALYLRVGSGALPVAPFTTDGDLALNPVGIADEPLLVEALTSAGFVLAVRPGSWTRDSVSIDLMVPATLCESGRRAARLGAHGADTARQTVGIEAALVDNDHLLLGALDPSDGRTHTVAVAGLAALLVAKLHELVDRDRSPARSLSKDGLDVLRILQECRSRGDRCEACAIGETPDGRRHRHSSA
jgi:hypothetical protein